MFVNIKDYIMTHIHTKKNNKYRKHKKNNKTKHIKRSNIKYSLNKKHSRKHFISNKTNKNGYHFRNITSLDKNAKQ